MASRRSSTSPTSARVVGIDLGTSHTVVAWTDPAGRGEAEVFPVAQQISATEVEARELFPSCLYAPLPAERADEDGPTWIAGEYARRRGTEVNARFVSSTKSWLCHSSADRQAPILPYGADDEDGEASPRISPIDASAQYLSHVRHAWDDAFPAFPLAGQDVVLTVPASFDEVARELTLEAAERAGLRVRLLEEPQAAFYDYMTREPGGLEALAQISDARGPHGALVMVVDVGGGTTDLSLFEVTRDEGGAARVSRVAVGRHLLLGGDNMDLALAHLLEPRLASGDGRLSPRQFAELTQACRRAKERMLGDDTAAAVDQTRISVLGTGSQLLGSTRSTELLREEVERVVLEGFLPRVGRAEGPTRARGGLIAFGLPYERDVAITRHLAAFFSKHGRDAAAPDAVLLNGGVFRAARISERVMDTFSGWGETPVRRLPNDSPDVAVARGAVAFGLALKGVGTRIEAGSARGYFVGLDDTEGDRRRGMCVVPRGAKEGAHHVTAGRTLALTLGRTVRFDVFSSDDAVATEAGQVVTLDDERFDALPPLAARLEGDRHEEVEVALEGELSAIGTLDLACIETNPRSGAPRRFRLAFQLREREGAGGPPSEARPSRRPGRALDPAAAAIDRVFGKSKQGAEPREVKNLFRDLEKLLGERATWTTETTRALADPLVERHKGRKRTADHERIYWQLVGFCLRPGYGCPGDEERVRVLAPTFAEKLAFSKETRTWQQFWIAWRRLAGGLSEADQLRIRDDTDPFLAPAEKKLKKPKGARPEALADLLDLVSSLEQVPPARRAELGGWILEKTWTDRDPRLWAAIGRLGARVPTYGSVHRVVPPAVAERWLDHLLREKWTEVPTAARAAVQLARVTGDRARDVPERMRESVAKRLTDMQANPRWIRAVRELVEVEDDDRAAFFGEGLPVGLRLVR